MLFFARILCTLYLAHTDPEEEKEVKGEKMLFFPHFPQIFLNQRGSIHMAALSKQNGATGGVLD